MEIINKKFVKGFFLALFIVAISLISWNSARIARPANIHSVKIAGQDIVVDLAQDEVTQEQGLSGRINLKEDEGMLFVFEQPGQHFFWMKDMNFPIDIIWINADMKVTYIKKDARPEFFPEQYGSQENAKYVLEVVAGFSDKNNLKEGDEVKFNY